MQTVTKSIRQERETEKNLMKLFSVNKAGKALAEAAEINNVSPEELINIVLCFAKKELSK